MIEIATKTRLKYAEISLKKHSIEIQKLKVQILKNINQIQIPQDKDSILALYHNFENINQTLTSILEDKPNNRSPSYHFLQRSKLSLLDFNQNGKFHPAKFAALILKLLYIDVSTRELELVLKLKSKKNQLFTMYQSLGRLLVQSKRKYEPSGVLALLKKIKEKHTTFENQTQNYINFAYNYQEREKCCAATFKIQSKKPRNRPFQKTISSYIEDPSKMTQLLIEIANHFSSDYQNDISVLIGYVLLVYGAVCFIQTIQIQKQRNTQKRYSSKQERWQLPIYSRQILYVVPSFRINIQETNSQQSGKKSLVISIYYQEGSLQRIDSWRFYNIQQTVANGLFLKTGSEFNILINEKIYCLDQKCILGSGGFGMTYQAKTLELFSISNLKEENAQKLKLKFKIYNTAIKVLKESTQMYEQRGYRVPRNREFLIHSLFKELKYYESLKKARKALDLQTERQLVGLSNLVIMEEMFKIKLNESNRKTFIIFQQGKGAMNQKKISEGLNNNRARRDLILSVYKQIFQGIYCMHYDINNLYSQLLFKYFRNQDQQQNYSNKNQFITSDQRCGIYHRDIKPGNIVLFFKDNLTNIVDIDEVKVGIIDYGMAGIINFETNKTKTSCGSRHYMAPQITLGEGYNEKVDIWSIGVMLYEHFNRDRLFQDNETPNYFHIDHYLQNFRNKIQDGQVFSIVSSCLTRDQKARKMALQILEQMNWRRFVVASNLRERAIADFYDQQTLKKQVTCFKIKKGSQILLFNTPPLKDQIINKQLSKFQLRQLMESQPLKLQQKIQILLAVLSALTIKLQQRILPSTLPLINTILAAQIVKISQDLLLIKFAQTKQTQVLPESDFQYKISSNISIIQCKKLAIIDENEVVVRIFKLVLPQQQRKRWSNHQEFFQGYESYINRNQGQVKFERIIFKKTQEKFKQCQQSDLFLSKRCFDERCIDYRYLSVHLFWFSQQQSQLSQVIYKMMNNVLSIFRKVFSIFSEVTIAQKPSLPYFLAQQQERNEQQTQLPKILCLGKIECKYQNLTITIDASVLKTLCRSWFKSNQQLFFSMPFKERLKQLFFQIKQIHKVEYKLVFQLSLLYYAQDSQHYEYLSQKLSPYAQNPTFFIAKMNMIINDFLVSAYQSSDELLKKVFIKFRDNLKGVGSFMYNEMDKKFTLSSIELQQQHYRSQFCSSKNMLQKFYKTMISIQKIINLNRKRLKSLKQNFEKYKYLFLFIDVFSWLFDKNDQSLILNLQILSQDRKDLSENYAESSIQGLDFDEGTTQ